MRTLKGFMTRDDYVSNDAEVVAPIFELSDYCNTYAKDKKSFYHSQNSLYSLKVFDQSATIAQADADKVSAFVVYFTNFATTNINMDYNQLLVNAVSSFNTLSSTNQVTQFTFNSLVTYRGVRTAEYLYFVVNNDIEALVWTASSVFKLVYPSYIVDCVFPMEGFSQAIGNPNAIIPLLEAFDYSVFMDRVNLAKGDYPPTHTRVLNVPYKVPNTTITKPCYFAFNVYNEQGNYDDILKLELFEYLLANTALSQAALEGIFPSLLEINEFFIIPRWDKISIATQVGQGSIYSQISSTFNKPFDLASFVKVYPADYMRTATYDVPTEYNNLLLNIINGYYTTADKKDFKTIYSDLITVSTTDPDFSRMSTITQNFLTRLYDLLFIANSDTFLDLYNKIFSNNMIISYKLRTRNDITYVAIRYLDHVYYILPRYEFLRLA